MHAACAIVQDLTTNSRVGIHVNSLSFLREPCLINPNLWNLPILLLTLIIMHALYINVHGSSIHYTSLTVTPMT